MQTFTFQIGTNMPYVYEWYEGFTFGDLFGVVRRALILHHGEEDVDVARMWFYDRENRLINVLDDSWPVEENAFIRVIYINENDVDWIERVPTAAIATWPWPEEWEGREEWEARQEYDPEDVDGDESWN